MRSSERSRGEGQAVACEVDSGFNAVKDKWACKILRVLLGEKQAIVHLGCNIFSVWP